MKQQATMFAREPAFVFVKCGSHRARERLTSLVGSGKLQCYFDFQRPSKGGYYQIPEAKLEEARKIPGVTRASHPDDLSPCWNS